MSLRKLKKLRRMIHLVVALQVLTLMFGLVAATKYVRQIITATPSATSIQIALQELAIVQQNISSGKDDVTPLLAPVNVALRTLSLPTIDENLSVGELSQTIADKQSALTTLLVKKVDRQTTHYWHLLMAGLGTVVFGIWLPIMILRKLQEQIIAIKNEVEQDIKLWIRSFGEKMGKLHGEDLRNNYFWIQVGLITLETFGRKSDSLLMKYAAELTPLIRSEIDKAKTANEDPALAS